MRYHLWSAFAPSQLLVYATIVGAVLLVAGRLRAGRALSLVGGLGLLLFGVLPLSHYLLAPLQERFPARPLPASVTGILLLAGSERPAATETFGEPQLNAHGSRYVTALRLALRHPEARVAFVGGPVRDASTGGLAQAGVARDLLPALGIGASRLVFELRSTDTCDSAVNARALLHPAAGETWVVVTSAVHLPRAMGCFRAAGFEVIPQPADFQGVAIPWRTGSFRVTGNLEVLDLALHEWVGLAYYRVTGRIRDLFPAP